MGRKAKFSKEVKIDACIRYLSGRSGISELKNEIGCDEMSLREWIACYENNGSNAFNEKKYNQTYTEEFKYQIICECERESTRTVAARYNISSSVVRNWIIKYNKGELDAYDPHPEVYEMKSRKVTLEEKIEIVKWTIENNNDYKGATLRYTVPYHSVFNWVKKYNELGEEGLKDNRGRSKSEKDLTELEKKDREIEKLKLELERVKRAEEILKKNLEIRTQLMKDSRKYNK